ncbi:MAG: rhomboid family intramembrane serine protease [Proteobacteria bacterium]|nr:rhomboid family intramembrane serine protease [Pseudomonadota bacterium]
MEKKSIICPGCGKLISNYSSECPYCELKTPAKKQGMLRLLGGGRRSFVKAIIVVNVVLFVASYLLPLVIPTKVPMGKGLMGLFPSPSYVALNLLGWADIRMLLSGSWWVLITAVFLHGGVLHILFNMLWVRDLGPQTELFFGSHRMVTIYILSGVAGNLVALFTPFLFNVHLGTDMRLAPVIGASGAVFGLMGSIVAYGRKRGGIFGRQLVRQLGMWALILIVMGFVFPGISNAAHIGGFATGFVVGQIMPIRRKPGGGVLSAWVAFGVIGICVLSFLMMVIRLVRVVGGL